jgi:hypothetical protein
MANYVKKQLEELNKIERNAKKQKVRNQCKCNHRDDDGNLTLVSVENKNDGKVTAYRCSSCDAIISKKAPTVQEMKDAINVVLTGLDYYKMGTMRGPNNTDKLSNAEAEDRRLIASVMESLISLIAGYEKAFNRNQQRNQQRNKRTRRSTTTYLG